MIIRDIVQSWQLAEIHIQLVHTENAPMFNFYTN